VRASFEGDVCSVLPKSLFAVWKGCFRTLPAPDQRLQSSMGSYSPTSAARSSETNSRPPNHLQVGLRLGSRLSRDRTSPSYGDPNDSRKAPSPTVRVVAPRDGQPTTLQPLPIGGPAL